MKKSTPPSRWITPEHLLGRWDAMGVLFAPPQKANWPTVGERGKVRVGWRPYTLDNELVYSIPIYRASDFKGLFLEPPDNYWQMGAKPSPGNYEVSVGDVAIRQFLSPKAAWVTSATPRLPLNTYWLKIEGLTELEGFWLCSYLNFPLIQERFAQQLRGAILPRLSAQDLVNLPFPPIPTGLEAIAVAWEEVTDRYYQTLRRFHRLLKEVEQVLTDQVPVPQEETIMGFCAAALVDDILLPVHLQRQSYQAALAQAGWLPLKPFLRERETRLNEKTLPSLRVLRLSDVNDRFGSQVPDKNEFEGRIFSLHAKPLENQEVLLSVLGSDPKIFFNEPNLTETIYVSDLWVRLRATWPGALALVLNSVVGRWQLQRSTTGVVQQQVSREALAKIRVPAWVEGDYGSELHDQLCRILGEFKSVEETSQSLIERVNGLITLALEGA